MYPQQSTTVRNVTENGSRFWETEVDEPIFGTDTVGVVDENEGGVVLYCHADNAEGIINALRQVTGEV